MIQSTNTNSNGIVENINKKIQKIKGVLYFFNIIFYISFLLQNQNKKYDILFLFFGITIFLFILDIANSKLNCVTFMITKFMLLTSLLIFGFFIYLCMDNFYYLWPYIFLYAIIILLYFMLNKHVTFLIQYITINYRNYVQYNLDNKECPVCLDTFNSGYIYTCNHFICETCFNNWVQINYNNNNNFIKCVTCRTGVINLNNIELNV